MLHSLSNAVHRQLLAGYPKAWLSTSQSAGNSLVQMIGQLTSHLGKGNFHARAHKDVNEITMIGQYQ